MLGGFSEEKKKKERKEGGKHILTRDAPRVSNSMVKHTVCLEFCSLPSLYVLDLSSKCSAAMWPPVSFVF